MAHSAPTLLVVDDDHETRDFVVHTLEDDGYAVTAVSTSMDCLKLLDSGAIFDLLIVDVAMPPSTPHGFALGRMAMLRNRHQKILYLSAVLDTLPENEVESPGGPILGKPVKPLEFLDTVRRVLESGVQGYG